MYSIIGVSHEDHKHLHADPNTMTQVQESTDTAQTIKELNEDKLDSNNFSSIDMKARLHPIEISSIICVDSLVALAFLPTESSFITRSKKRLSVSVNGLGRKEIVDVAGGMKEAEQGKGAFARIGAMFGGK